MEGRGMSCHLQGFAGDLMKSQEGDGAGDSSSFCSACQALRFALIVGDLREINKPQGLFFKKCIYFYILFYIYLCY